MSHSEHAGLLKKPAVVLAKPIGQHRKQSTSLVAIFYIE